MHKIIAPKNNTITYVVTYGADQLGGTYIDGPVDGKSYRGRLDYALKASGLWYGRPDGRAVGIDARVDDETVAILADFPPGPVRPGDLTWINPRGDEVAIEVRS